MTADILPPQNIRQRNVGFLQVPVPGFLPPRYGRYHRLVRTPHRAAPAAPDRAAVDLAPVDDAILTLLAKRLARALLLDADDEAGPDTTGRSSRPA
jgi:hypothetical protein